jgi:hypothetical protein
MPSKITPVVIRVTNEIGLKIISGLIPVEVVGISASSYKKPAIPFCD